MQGKANPRNPVSDARKLNDDLFKKARNKVPKALLQATWEAAERLIDFHRRRERRTA